MRIGIFGNDNNLGVLIAEALTQLGHTPRLVLTRKEPRHRPESYAERFAAQYPDWMLDASEHNYDEYGALTPRLTPALNFLEHSDLLILGDVGPSLATLWGRPYVCLITGRTLVLWGDFRTFDLMRGWGAEFRRSAAGRLATRHWVDLVTRQRLALAAAASVLHPVRGVLPDHDALLDDIGVAEERRRPLLARFPTSTAPPAKSSHRLRVLCGVPINWRQPLPYPWTAQDHTAYDVVLQGVAAFAASNPTTTLDLRLVERGGQVAEIKPVVTGLGLDPSVTWLPELPLTAYVSEVAQADVVLAGTGTAAPGPNVWTAIGAGKPVIGDLKGHVLREYFGEDVPACHATNAAEIAAWLQHLAADRTSAADLGARAQRFAARQLVLPGQLERLLSDVTARF